MRILFLGGNLARTLTDWLVEQGDDVIYREDKVIINDIKQINPDFIISYNYKHIIPKEIIDYVNGKAINLHISYLPYNRGSYPNVWSFLEDTPKGVTIHYINEGIDTGDVIVQKEVFINEEKETLKSSYEILHREIQELFKENWEKIKTGAIKPKKQTGGGVSTLRESLQPLTPSLEKRDGIPQSENLRKNIVIGAVILINFVNLTTEEKEMVLAWRNHKNIRMWMYSDHVISQDEHFRFMENIKQDNKNFYWLVKNKEGYAGVISLNRMDFNNKNAHIGIYSNPELSGVGSMLMDCLKKLAFDIAHLHTLKAEVIETNEHAINFYKKSGFNEEGRLKEFVFKDGKWLDVIVIGMIESHF
ncbi:MAG: UDP-4-amino-4,6-dideoxy-N-acetyl-beta-L-altrosamine N-acetyltransferase [Candidatus Brocadia sp.]|jgi:UDP-4-amino-4,6-dideoxy-N-acetyl-beta-L-altrosamine N-acetyltransferase